MRPKRILIPHDSNVVRRAVHSCLTRGEFEVCGKAADDEEAIEKARALKPDLILLDVAMPRTNGIIATSVLKNTMPNDLIVLFTMYGEAVARTFSRQELAFDAVVAKADGLARLTECVRNLLH